MKENFQKFYNGHIRPTSIYVFFNIVHISNKETMIHEKIKDK